jgi:hypothetical protein
MIKKKITPKEWLDCIFKKYPSYESKRSKLECAFRMELNIKMDERGLKRLFEKCWPHLGQPFYMKRFIYKALMDCIEYYQNDRTKNTAH